MLHPFLLLISVVLFADESYANMRIFLCWSGERSRVVANALRRWLPTVLEDVQTWMSEKDIAAGRVWDLALMNVLRESRIGLVVATPENSSAPWLNFESGALAMSCEAE